MSWDPRHPQAAGMVPGAAAPTAGVAGPQPQQQSMINSLHHRQLLQQSHHLHPHHQQAAAAQQHHHRTSGDTMLWRDYCLEALRSGRVSGRNVTHIQKERFCVRLTSVANLLSPEQCAKFIKDIIGLLKNRNSEVRAGAAWALGQLKEASAVAHLAALLTDSSATVRRRAVEAMGNIGKRACAPFAKEIAALLSDPDANVRRGCVRTMGQLREHAAPFVRPLVDAALRDRDSAVRDRALDVLAHLREPVFPVVKGVAQLLRDRDAEVREWALWALRQLQRHAGPFVHDVVVLLRDPLPNVRRSALEELGCMTQHGGPSVVEAVAALMRDPDASVRSSAVQTLLARKEHAAQPYSKHIAQLLRDSDPGVRCSAIEALRYIGGEYAAPYVADIAQLLRSDPVAEVRRAAGWALVTLKEYAAAYVGIMVLALNDVDMRVRRSAVWALRLQRRHAVSMGALKDIIVLLNSHVPGVRRCAIDVLAHMQKPIVRQSVSRSGKQLDVIADTTDLVPSAAAVELCRVTTHIVRLLGDSNALVRDSAVMCCGLLREYVRFRDVMDVLQANVPPPGSPSSQQSAAAAAPAEDMPAAVVAGENGQSPAAVAEAVAGSAEDVPVSASSSPATPENSYPNPNNLDEQQLTLAGCRAACINVLMLLKHSFDMEDAELREFHCLMWDLAHNDLSEEVKRAAAFALDSALSELQSLPVPYGVPGSLEDPAAPAAGNGQNVNPNTGSAAGAGGALGSPVAPAAGAALAPAGAVAPAAAVAQP